MAIPRLGVLMCSSPRACRASPGRRGSSRRPFGQRGRLRRIIAQILEQDDELVAAEARDTVALAHRLGQPPCDLLQEQIADLVSAGVVELLEVVQVDEDQCAVLPRACRGGQRLIQPVEQEPAIRESGQRVVEGEPANRLLGFLALAHVGQGADIWVTRARGRLSRP
jgi:hypothetical protein